MHLIPLFLVFPFSRLSTHSPTLFPLSHTTTTPPTPKNTMVTGPLRPLPPNEDLPPPRAREPPPPTAVHAPRGGRLPLEWPRLRRQGHACTFYVGECGGGGMYACMVRWRCVCGRDCPPFSHTTMRMRLGEKRHPHPNNIHTISLLTPPTTRPPPPPTPPPLSPPRSRARTPSRQSAARARSTSCCGRWRRWCRPRREGEVGRYLGR